MGREERKARGREKRRKGHRRRIIGVKELQKQEKRGKRVEKGEEDSKKSRRGERGKMGRREEKGRGRRIEQKRMTES